MKMEVEMISKECIKPSSPTPCHLKNHKLSLFDLYLPPIYVPIVLYYPFNQDTNLSPSQIHDIISARLQMLKQSLSEILSSFYPFAGKIKDLLSVDCNDEGIYFVEARVKSSLSEFLNHPDNSLITKLLSDDAKWFGAPVPGNYVAGVQVTTFACGGIVVGAFVSHMIADGTTFSWFLKSWAAATARNNNNNTNIEQVIIHPKLDAVSLLPQNDQANGYPREVCSSAVFTSHIKFDNFITRRFVFDASAIANLKAMVKSRSSSGVQNPSRVEVVTAFLTKSIITALKSKSEYKNYKGNFVWMASAELRKDDKETDQLHGLVSQLREAITKVNGDFVNSLQGDEGVRNFLEAVKHESETCASAADNIVFTSWCNLGFYEIDFGWGKPAWASVYGLAGQTHSHNLIVLMDTKLGNGIEAWVYLPQEDMATLELDKQLLQFASMDPSPLN
ncbi:vinorine synthase-like [Melia azedarach]|uniref:Vinorine synthase-like n=1 Tax=Melia azedarach TaxID=155640 RepID=A0ACC1WT85_MELAZ|nr:vinorine synthase-like [Melia azedarach]